MGTDNQLQDISIIIIKVTSSDTFFLLSDTEHRNMVLAAG